MIRSVPGPSLADLTALSQPPMSVSSITPADAPLGPSVPARATAVQDGSRQSSRQAAAVAAAQAAADAAAAARRAAMSMKRVSRRISQSAFDLPSPPPSPQDSDAVSRPAPLPARHPRPLSQVSALEEWGEEDSFSIDPPPPSDPRHFSFASTASVGSGSASAPSSSKALGGEAALAKPQPPSGHAAPHSYARLPSRAGGDMNNAAVPASSELRTGRFLPPGTPGFRDGPFISGRLSSSAMPGTLAPRSLLPSSVALPSAVAA
ncbi:hypothetical protein HK405_004745 [Cladochytrium tenue]|nr:hypothetical protein HK405_004745 [Cladochytrium tenue]